MTTDVDEKLQQALDVLTANRQDDDAWATIVDVTFPMVLATANKTFRGEVDLAKDAAWDTYTKLARYTNFAPLALQGPSAFRAYLRKVARTTSLDVLRSVARASPEMVVSDLTEFADPGEDPEAVLSAVDLLREIEGILSPGEQQLLKLLLVGKSTAEIARLLGGEYSARGVEIHRLRKKIRAFLAKKHGNLDL